jgi:chemotaxis protein methyltransferase CheR
MELALLKQTKDLIANRIGLLVREQDDALLHKVIADRVRALHLASAEQYCVFLGSDADIRLEREALANFFTTGETYFFRDSGQYALLQNQILPELLERRKRELALRIWCAACATGEEAYSLSILLDELMIDRSRWNIFILGTDINPDAIEKARLGIYTDWSFRGTSGERQQRHFRQNKSNWILDNAVRRSVTFRKLDLLADEFPDQASELYDMDLILCRNTFIYMSPHAVSRITDKFADTLADGGILLTGHGELYAHHSGKLCARVFPESIVYQKAPAAAVLPDTESSLEIPARTIPAAVTPHQKYKTIFQAEATASTLKPQADAITRRDAPVSEMQLAWQYANRGQRDKAAKCCGVLVEKNPLTAEPHYLLALLAQESGDFAEAKDRLKKVIYLDPLFIAAYLDLGDLYEREGDVARAEKMRATARDLLQALPGDEPFKIYGASTVKTVLQYVEHLLDTHHALRQ